MLTTKLSDIFKLRPSKIVLYSLALASGPEGTFANYENLFNYENLLKTQVASNKKNMQVRAAA